MFQCVYNVDTLPVTSSKDTTVTAYIRKFGLSKRGYLFLIFKSFDCFV